MRRPRGPFVLAWLLALASCAHHEASHAARPPAGPEVPALAYYEAGGAPRAPLRVERAWREAEAESWEIDLPPRLVPAVAGVPHAGDPIRLEVLQPLPLGTGRRPLVLVLPILSNRKLLLREFASGFLREGYVVAFLPRKDVELDAERSLGRAEEELRLQVMRARQALDWLALLPQVDPARLGVFGISAGGILAATLMGADPRLRAGVMVFAGGPMADVMVDTVERKFASKTEEIRRLRGWDRERVRAELRARIRTDPVLLAPRVHREDVLLFIASDDTSVPTRTQRMLWEALGRPEAYELPGGHSTGVALHLPFLIERARAFLRRKLGTP